MNIAIQSALRNWIPYKLSVEGNEAFCKWLFLGDKNFTEPFFDSTISGSLHFPINSKRIKCISSIVVLPEWSASIESIQPSAIIFHVSRCGSTLVSQLLALNPSNIVLSEVPFFDELLRHRNDEHDPLQLLESAIAFYSAKRNNEQKHVFVKTDSWHIFFYDLYRKLYPQIPFIFLYRRPDEVIRSQQKQRGMHAVPGLIEPDLFGFDKNEIMDMGLDEYMAKVLERYFESFIEILKKDKLAFAINYNEGGVAMIEKIAARSGISIDEHEMQKIKERAGYHAKYPDRVFSEEVIQNTIPAYCVRSFELYEMLEKVRNDAITFAR